MGTSSAHRVESKARHTGEGLASLETPTNRFDRDPKDDEQRPETGKRDSSDVLVEG